MVMKTTLFYFSATGNSLALTRNLANKIGNCEIVNIAKANRESSVKIVDGNIGFIFPVYAWGMPRIVAEFIEKLKCQETPEYVFAIVTCVAIQGNTLQDLKILLKKNQIPLHAGFSVKAPSASMMKLNSLDTIIMKLDKQRFKTITAIERVDELARLINNKTHNNLETSSFLANIFGSKMHKPGVNIFKTKDQEFEIQSSCTNCGTCTRVCPRQNITIENGKPVFHQNCELCHACIQWCPNFAIRHKDFDPERNQYHNSEIKLQDILQN
jgi:ferredoxin